MEERAALTVADPALPPALPDDGGEGGAPVEGRERRRGIPPTLTQEAFVLLLRSFAPLASIYTLYRIAVAVVWAYFPSSAPTHPPLPTLPLALEVFIYLETVFLVYMMWRSRVLARRQKPPPIGREEIEVLVRRMIAHTTDMKALISGWFMDVPFDELSRDDLYKFVAWMIYSKHPHELESEEEQGAVCWTLESIEASIGHAVPSVAQGGKAHTCMRHTLDPLQSKHRPLLAYFISHWLLNTVCAAGMLYKLGFRRHRTGKITYWRRPALSGCQASLPVVFVHGIGMGLFTYWSFVHALAGLPAEVFLVELPHASLKICEMVPADQQAVSALVKMLARHGHQRAVFAGHSLGSVYLSWLCRLAPECVAASVFIEPIVFMLFLKTVTHSFLYNDYGGIVGYAIRSELFLNHALRRHFWWSKNLLWIEDVTHPSHVFLCEADEVVPTSEVVRYIRTHDFGHHITTEVMDTDWHGQWLFQPERVDLITRTIDHYRVSEGAGVVKGVDENGISLEEEGKAREEEEGDRDTRLSAA